MNFQLKKQYQTELKQLEENTKKLENQIVLSKREKTEIEDNLNDSEKENLVLKEKIRELEADKHELEAMLKQANNLNKQQAEKNSETLQKLDETIEVAEKAMQEINNLILEKKQIEDELNYLTETIAGVFEEKVEKTDKEMELQSLKHKEQIMKLEQEILRYQNLLEKETRKKEEASSKSQLLSRTNNYLDQDLKLAFNQVENTELKLKALEKSILNEQKSNKLCEEQLASLQFIIKKKNEYKAVYHNLLLEIMKVMENLLIENKSLKSEINAIQRNK